MSPVIDVRVVFLNERAPRNLNDIAIGCDLDRVVLVRRDQAFLLALAVVEVVVSRTR